MIEANQYHTRFCEACNVKRRLVLRFFRFPHLRAMRAFILAILCPFSISVKQKATKLQKSKKIARPNFKI